MASKFCLDGVCASFKTTLLTSLRALKPQWVVETEDYDEVAQKLGLNRQNTKNAPVNALIYTAYRNAKSYHPDHIYVCDRHPMASLVYSYVFSDETTGDDALLRIFTVAHGIDPEWRGLILLPKPGQELKVLELMRKRNNGIDWMSEEYISRQVKIFKLWSRATRIPIHYIDYEANIEDEQDIILNMLLLNV
ncbi:NRK-1 [Plodia interpunctella granulovirus]|uniref:NRK-1 n=1 Tax=Plodia interpunctella granulovirus TaxID=262175 RepID=A0A1L5JHF6_9BBAC|nr:NRK-1 [Plodia interpunctella granulovirus]APO13910.1 NRK-1 [Plodia interpunctella granulovirus]